MASIKVKFRRSSVPDSAGTVYYQIIHKRIVRQLTTSFNIFPNEWDDKKGSVISNFHSSRYEIVKAIQNNILWDIKLLGQVFDTLITKRSDCSTDDWASEFLCRKKRSSLFNFLNETITKLQKLGKARTAETYSAALASFRKFRKDEDILLHDIDSDIMEKYQAHLSLNGLTPNTISFYMRILRATYNRAVESGLIEQASPFRRVYTGVAKTVKRAISLRAVKAIKMLDLSQKPTLEFARDMFLFSFYTRGMSFVDIAYLKKSDFNNGTISYRRKKTGQLLHVACEKSVMLLIERYQAEVDSPYLLSIITKPDKDTRKQYHAKMYAINKSLKEVARLAKVDVPLTLYVARHSWASIAHIQNIPVSIISESMGHESEATTQIYLASLDVSAVNKANSQIIEALENC
ncbi:MAG: site-specific integrase [Muribaculaceae bacterium]|nr:site-specific integrase [Muribaculaceae bacterium]